MRVVAAAAVVASGSALVVDKSSKLRASAAVRGIEAPPAKGSYRQILSNFQNVQYFGEFYIGGQPISGIFDTGSFELLVRSTRCSACAHPTSPYDRTVSSSYKKNGTVAKHVYGSGPCISMKGYEDVTVGPMRSNGQAFWEIMQHQIQALDTAKFAAIVGIGPNFAYGNKDQTLLMNFGVKEFSVCLKKPSDSNGYLTWGSGLSDEYKDKNFAKANVIGKHHWVARMHNMTFSSPSGAHLENVPCMGSGCAAIIDSGTSLIAAPAAALMQLSTQIQPIKEDCSNLHELPTLHFNIDGTDFALPPQAYVMRITGAVLEADSVWDILFFKPKIRKVNMCMPAFMQIEMTSQNGPVWILGMPFFRYYHTIFDRRSQAMHFALAGPDCEALPFSNNGTHGASKQALLATTSELQGPLGMDVKSIVPPTLSEMIDGPIDL